MRQADIDLTNDLAVQLDKTLDSLVELIRVAQSESEILHNAANQAYGDLLKAYERTAQ